MSPTGPTTATPPPVSVARRAASVVTALAMVVVLAGCTSVRSNLGTTDDACYLALPAATQAVAGTGKLIGVHLVNVRKLERESTSLTRALGLDPNDQRQVCTIAFSGRFRSQSVAMPRGQTSGRFAVVVLTSPANRLIGTVLLDRVPLRFGHPHVG
jgi:hypothetical protein